jgi:glycosyltransferase involved in cell wall biosynthesis
MEFVFNAPFNGVSFGQVSTAIARELHESEADCCISPIQGNADFQSQSLTKDFVEWFSERTQSFHYEHSRKNPSLKLWHLMGALESVSHKQVLFSFYELGSPTKAEINIAKNNDEVVFSSQASVDAFASHGVNAHYIPLGFDKHNFKVTDRKYFDDDRIVFNLCGKFEKRKHHEKIMRAWAKKYGNSRKYFLQCAVFNSFLSPQDNNNLIGKALEGKKYPNITLLGMMQKNSEYNDFLNSANIVIGMSGGEGWGLPEFQSVGLGKHAVVMDAHGYKGWANEANSVLVQPSTKIDAEDGLFFKRESMYNKGEIFDFNEDDFISACEQAIKRVESNKINEEGLKLQDKFSYKETTEKLLKLL